MKKLFKFGCLGFSGLIVLIIVIAVVASNGGDDNDINEKSEISKEKTTETKKADKKGLLTKEKFNQIEEGMSYDEVVKIVGSKGNLISETGEEGTDLHTVMYDFETDGFMSNSSMMFQGGKLINKTQIGLGGGDSVEISLEQFNKIKNGMSLEEVIEITGGEGEVISESGEKGTDLYTVMYSYNGKNIGSNVSLMFQGNKLQNKTQVGLD